MSVILGVNAYHAGAAAAVVVDGVPAAAIAEERLNRVKYYAGFPRLAIQRCLEIAGLELKDVSAVAVGRDPSANVAKKLEFALRNPSKLLNLAKIRKKGSAFADMKTMISRECGVEESTLSFTTHNVEHHLAHTASAYFSSDWEHCAGVTIDGSGDFVSCMLSECQGDEIRPLRRVFVPHSLGTVYTAVSHFIGYGKYGDEGKVMGLASLGSDTYREFFEGMMVRSKTGFTLNPSYFLPFGTNQGMEIDESGEMVIHRLYSDKFIDELGEPREPYSDIAKRDMDIAFGLQRIFEDTYLHLLGILHAAVPTHRVSLAGGCALNSVANGKLLLETPFTETCIQPAAGDDGLALGAALYVSNSILKEGVRWKMVDSYLGDEWPDSVIRAELERLGLKFEELDRESLLERTSTEILRGKIVGWFQGRMEWGPRALGNRSILAHPGFPGIKERLNSRIKQREAFRPFAASVRGERQSELFEQIHPSPFMLHVYKIRAQWRERLSAVAHVDETARLQTVSRDENPLYYDLICAFERKSGVPAILNTSFNENEPIVCTPNEAIECFLRTKMDVLVIGSFFCSRGE